MYQAGDWVVYGIQGVCRVVGTEKQLVNRKRTQYLVLEPLAQPESRFYLPVDNPTAIAKLQSVLTRAQLEQLLSSEQVRRDVWIPAENLRKQHYREMIGSGDREVLMQIVYTLHRHKASQLAAGKQFHQADENFLRDAEKLLSSEIALTMSLSTEDARDYLRRMLAES
jgi:CarD family transcriptional regulator